MVPKILALALALGFATATAPAALAQGTPLTEQEAHAIGVDAYLYFYPLVSMDITRKQFTNVEPGKVFGKAPMNMFVSEPEYPPADFKGVVRVNFDTLFSIAWLDLTKEPMTVSAADTGGRFYLLPMLDMWTDVFASPGWRTTGTQAGNFLVTPPAWTGTVPAGMARISAPTPYVWIIGRTKTDGPADYEAVHKIQAGFKITPLSEWGKPVKPVAVKIDPGIDMTTPPKVQPAAITRYHPATECEAFNRWRPHRKPTWRHLDVQKSFDHGGMRVRHNARHPRRSPISKLDSGGHVDLPGQSKHRLHHCRPPVDGMPFRAERPSSPADL